MKIAFFKLSAVTLALLGVSTLAANAANSSSLVEYYAGALSNNGNTLSFINSSTTVGLSGSSTAKVTKSTTKTTKSTKSKSKTSLLSPSEYQGIWYMGPKYVYNKNGTKLGLVGEFEAGIIGGKGSRTTFQNLGSTFGVQASQLLNKKYDINAIFYGSINFGDDTSSWSGVNEDKLFAGFNSHSFGQLTFGSQDTIGDYTDLASFAEEFSGIGTMNAYAKDTVVYFSPKVDGFSFGANYTFGNQDYGTSKNEEGYGLLAQYDGKVNKNVSFTLQASVGGSYNQSYSSASDASSAYNGDTVTTVGSQTSTIESATVTFNNTLTLGAAYSYLKASKGDVINLEGDIGGTTPYDAASYYTDANKLSGYELGANYQYNKLGNSIYTDVDMLTAGKGSVTTTAYILGTSYYFNSSTMVYLEGVLTHYSGNGTSNGVDLGFNFYF